MQLKVPADPYTGQEFLERRPECPHDCRLKAGGPQPATPQNARRGVVGRISPFFHHQTVVVRPVQVTDVDLTEYRHYSRWSVFRYSDNRLYDH
jgi:hypothetical protein